MSAFVTSTNNAGWKSCSCKFSDSTCKNQNKVHTHKEYKKCIIEALNEGRYAGTGQWRGSGKKGTFLWEEFDDDKNVIGGNTKDILGVTTKDKGFNDALVEYINNAMVGETEESFD